MPKNIELTVELEVQRVSCPGVWLCQDGRVSLTLFTLGTSYQTCLLPPSFPLQFKDVFYFRKRFQQSCALNNICCLLKDETIYCELVQWCEDCEGGGSTILAQYLGALNDILFPPNMCSNEGVDLLMRRSKEFPGILSPKIEIATKVRIDEVWTKCSSGTVNFATPKATPCDCLPPDELSRQKQVCHTTQYHRKKCFKKSRSPIGSSRSKSHCSIQANNESGCKTPFSCSRPTNYAVYNVFTERDSLDNNAYYLPTDSTSLCDDGKSYRSDTEISLDDEKFQRTLLESRYVEHDRPRVSDHSLQEKVKRLSKCKPMPCICEICKRYHDLFHTRGG